MSHGVDAADDDASMTRDAGASRTFRSLFGREQAPVRADGLKRPSIVQQAREHNSHRDADASSGAVGGYSSSANGGRRGERENDDDDDDDDEGAWSGADDERDNNATVAATAPRDEGLRIPPVRAMEQWADDEDDEDAWKDLLQAKVNQLELVAQSSAGGSSPVTSLANATATTAIAQLAFAPAADARIALAAATHIAALRGADRPAMRGKLQRAADAHQRQGTASAAATVSPSNNYLRKRTGSRDSGASSRVVKGPAAAGDAKRHAKATASSRRDALGRSLSTSALARLSHATHCKNSLDAYARDPHSRSSSSSADSHRPAATASAAADDDDDAISDAEAVRRFLLDDIKQMSMDRLVADAKRLQFLEALYTHEHSGGAHNGDDDDSDSGGGGRGDPQLAARTVIH